MQEDYSNIDKESDSENIPKETIELLPPNFTIYIRNLNEKIPLDGFFNNISSILQKIFFISNVELKQELFNLFSPYGNILDVIAKRNIRMRGQAFIIFQELSSAVEAVKEMQDYSFYQKPMVFI